MTGGLSLRARLLAGIAVVVVVLIAVAAAVTTLIQRHLVDQVDRGIVEAAESGRGRPLATVDNQAGEAAYAEALWLSIDEHRALMIPYGSARPALSYEQVVDAARSGEPFTVGSEDGGTTKWRVVAAPARNGGIRTVAAPLDGVDDVIDRLIVIEAVATVGVVLVLGAVAWWVIRLGIRPVKQMTATASAIAAGDLSQRVPDVAPSTEAGQLGLALNNMMEQLERAFRERVESQERLQRFVADASHELRTPVTTIRGYAELYRLGGLGGDEQLAEAMRRTEQESVRMARLVDDMLTIAKLGAGRPLERGPVDLSRIVEDVAADARVVAPDRTITVDAAPSLVVSGDDDRLRQVVVNIVGNALTHTPAGTAIELRAVRRGDVAELTVTDHGEGMPPEVAAKVTERFYRADPSRSRDRGGSGLGMAIVDAAVSAHGGSVEVLSELGAGTTVRVTLPADPFASPPSVPPAV